MTVTLVRPAAVYQRYTPAMADTTIKVDPAVRDRLLELARERGITMRDLVAELAGATPTREELRKRYEETRAYVEEHFLGRPYTEEDEKAGVKLWADLEAGRIGEVQ
jgi:predicted transcriptional regulator